MKKRSLRIFVAALMLLALTFSLAGCGKESSGTKGNTIVIGIGAPLTQGTVAIGQGIKRGVELAVETMNNSEEASELGIFFKTSEGDDQGDPKTGVNAANTFASDRSVIGVVGHYNSGVTIPASKVYLDNGITMVSPGATSPNVTAQGFKNVFRTCATDAVQGPAGADAALALGYKTAVVIDDSTPYGEGLAQEFAKTYKAGGGTIHFEAKTQDKDTDFNALVTRMKAANPDIVYYAGLYNAGALLTKQMKDAGLNVPIMGGDGLYDLEYIRLAGGMAEGDYTFSVGLPVSMLPLAEQFEKDYAAKFGGQEIGAFDAYAYDAAMAIMKAVLEVAREQGASAVTSPAGREAVMEATANVSFEGVTGPVSFDENGDTNNKTVTLYKVVNGQWEPQDLN